MHTGAVVLEQWLGHESGRHSVLGGHVFDDVLVEHNLIRHPGEGVVFHVKLTLSGGGYLVMLGLHINAYLYHSQGYFGAKVLELIGGGHGEIALLVAGLVAKVSAVTVTRVPDALHGVNKVEATVGVLVKADAVK
jgi:hypothetical protein